MGCNISQLTEPTILFHFEKDEDGEPVLVKDFNKYIIRLESESYGLQKDNLSPDTDIDADLNNLSITLTQQETMNFSPREKIKMQVYFEREGIPGVTNIKITTIEEVLGFEGVIQ